MSATVRRALFHVLTVASIAVAALFAPEYIFLTVLTAIGASFLTFELLRLKFAYPRKWFYRLFGRFVREEEARRPTGASYTLMASLIVFHLFPSDIAILAFIFMAIGDPVATLVGTYLGRIRIHDKTLEGHLACFGTCVLTGYIYTHLVTPISPALIIAGSMGATIGEALPHRLNDNLTMPILAAGAMLLPY